MSPGRSWPRFSATLTTNMVDRAFGVGELIIYPYRWRSEVDQNGSVDGANDRPCCIVVSLTRTDGKTLYYLAAISSKPPSDGQAALVVPPLETRRGGLDPLKRAWVYVGEVNADVMEDSPYLEPQAPLGTFCKTFMIKIRAELHARFSARQAKVVTRPG